MQSIDIEEHYSDFGVFEWSSRGIINCRFSLQPVAFTMFRINVLLEIL